LVEKATFFDFSFFLLSSKNGRLLVWKEKNLLRARELLANKPS